MTSIVAWAGVDARGVASAYIASDSRISWGAQAQWDQGRKVFATVTQPHIFGYWGDVLFPALAIPVVIERIDRASTAGSGSAHALDVGQAFRSLWRDYPRARRTDMGILHAYRMGEGMESQFAVDIITYEARTDTWATTVPAVPIQSSILHLAGTGAHAIRETHQLWQASPAANTSRAVFSAFCESIAVGRDVRTGGAPQLVGLYRVGPGRSFGVVYGGQRYFAGSRLLGDELLREVEWRNELFERVDAARKRRLSGAQQHAPRSGRS
jgi:hypothetical protein